MLVYVITYQIPIKISSVIGISPRQSKMVILIKVDVPNGIFKLLQIAYKDVAKMFCTRAINHYAFGFQRSQQHYDIYWTTFYFSVINSRVNSYTENLIIDTTLNNNHILQCVSSKNALLKSYRVPQSCKKNFGF